MINLLFILFWQTSIDAGPVQTMCQGEPTILAATLIEPPSSFRVRWDDASQDDYYLEVNPSTTRSYTVQLFDFDQGLVFSDTTRVLVPTQSSDFDQDGLHGDGDWFAFYPLWNTNQADLDGDGSATILDWFYICNRDQNPFNTPPEVRLLRPAETWSGESLVIQVEAIDQEQTPVLSLTSPPDHGIAFFLSGQLTYSPEPGFFGFDQLTVQASDGHFTSYPLKINIELWKLDTWTDLYNDIFSQECKACHIDAVSGGLSLSTYEQAQHGGNSGSAFIAGSPQLSPLYLRTSNGSMPPNRPPLTRHEQERIYQWILRGAQED